ncbi:PREDICTED: fatty-acid amide hydrolase 2-like [Nicrophorus vespilloides]|uniref:Fatty-acid amide hydrolase 2-like n=1 Tax=Nicrophorus vespilloides TaxID=110193 RepID=A0ABM1N8Z3_NICVS|nr:PREDICTED: fatty-acid amide hydrolase 2-like [Nicrophorus vespilloides]
MELLLRILSLILRIFSWIASPIFWIMSTSGRKVPPIQNEILLINARSLAEKIRRRELKSVDVVKAYVARIQEVNRLVNAVVEDRYCDAVLEAKAVDSYLDSIQSQKEELQKVQRDQPLLGVPLTVKESCSLKGMSIATGSVSRIGLKAKENGTAVANLLKAGAIPLLISNTPEYCFYWESNNLVTGLSKNPYNTAYSTGGSSGGEGALLGAGASLIGVGSDLLGSIRLPSYFNGVFGHKATEYVTPIDQHFPSCEGETLRQFFSIGPMARYADDLTLMLKLITSPHSSNLRLDEPVDLNKLRVYYMEETESSLTLPQVDKEIKNAVVKSANYLQRICGSQLEDEKFDMENLPEMICALMMSATDVPKILKDNNKNDHLLLEFVKNIFNQSKYSTHALLVSLVLHFNGGMPKGKKDIYGVAFDKMKRNLLEKLGDDGVLILPTFPTLYQHNEFALKSIGIMYLGFCNLSGFPATQVPMGLNKKGLPIGIQVIATPHNDRLCLAVAKELEKGFSGWVPPQSSVKSQKLEINGIS